MDGNLRNNNNSLGRNIRNIRQKLGWSQEEAAARLSISVPALSKIETGVTDVNLSRLEQIAAVFDVPIKEIFVLKTEDSVTEINMVEKKIQDREAEISHLKSQVIYLYEELRKKHVMAKLF
jgi:transcriptional regulator with XRE-family HTH domain